MSCIIRDSAREYFENSNINRDALAFKDFQMMGRVIEKHLIEYYINGGEHAKKMDMKVAKLRGKDVVVRNGKFEGARIQIDGSYFKRREGVTFSTSGWIGLGSEFSDCNVEPICNGFKEWVDIKVTE